MRSERIKGRGEAVTNEERKLARDKERRNAVLAIYRKFDIVEVDTSNLDAAGVLEKVLPIINHLSRNPKQSSGGRVGMDYWTIAVVIIVVSVGLAHLVTY